MTTGRMVIMMRSIGYYISEIKEKEKEKCIIGEKPAMMGYQKEENLQNRRSGIREKQSRYKYGEVRCYSSKRLGGYI